MKPFVKWAGGKEGELKYILPSVPKKINKYVEPFVGGGAVYFALLEKQIQEYYINDFSRELIDLYEIISIDFASFYAEVKTLMHNWQVLEKVVNKNREFFLNCCRLYGDDRLSEELDDEIASFILVRSQDFNGLMRAGENAKISDFEYEIKKYIIRKIKRIRKIDTNNCFSNKDQINNIITAFKAGYYTHVRNLYNQREEKGNKKFFTPAKRCAYFYFLREYCYSSMFRYNKKGEFNVPYGGMAYNTKNILGKVKKLEDDGICSKLKKTLICNQDFEKFLNTIKFERDDFVFLDPPYDSEFNEYAQNSFTKNDQKRLANWAVNTKAKVMIVIKNTEFIYNLYKDTGLKISSFDKKYMVNFNNRNDRKVKHLLITNY